MPAVAITDHGNMHGAIELYKACKKAGIKPIIGVEAYIAERTRFDKESGIDNKRYHLTLLARNAQGYRNLMKMISRSHLEGYYYKPRMDEDLLREFSEGIICLTGCPSSRFIQAVKNENLKEARRLLELYIELYTRECVFIEVMKHDEVEWYPPLIPSLKELAKEYGLSLVATWDSHYLHVEDREAHNTLLAINTNDLNFKFDGEYAFIDYPTASEIYADIPEAVDNTMKVADLVNIELVLDTWNFPRFEIPEGQTYESYLRKLTYEHISTRYSALTDEVRERIEYELDVIEYKGFSVYLLIVHDLVEFAHTNGILTNIRGSVAGSIVTYILGITNVDPLHFKLPFTRFLNKERPSPPDIDMDFADNRRDEVINYARAKYGTNAVAQIGTFGTMLARGAVRDVARALGYPYGTGDRIAKLIPEGSQGFPMTLDYALELTQEFQELYKSDAPTKHIVDMAKKIEGCVRHVSVHAAGVVISPSSVDDYSPVQLDPKGGKIITQYDMYAVESAGLIKFDFLGIRNLAILADAIERVEKIRHIAIDLEKIPIDDTATYEMLARGETMGVFQMSGGGMTKYLKDLKPESIYDINAMVALYRPGPIDVIPEYIKRKNNPSLITYLDPRMKKILDQSYGVITYQDDVLLISIELAGFSWLEADALRKAMGKKIPALMKEQRKKFLTGLKEHGMADKKAQELWELIEPFAAYGFNKAHAASYGQLAYRTAYMKAHYPQEYMSAILTAESGNMDKIIDVINECKRMNFVILPPDINESYSDFTVVVDDDTDNVTNNIRFGLRSIKNFGDEIGKAIIAERKRGGRFSSLENFLERNSHRNLNKKSLEALIMCGALDSLGERGHLITNSEAVLAFHKDIHRDAHADQISLFADFEDAPQPVLKLSPAEPASQSTKLTWERELIGLYVSGHPLDRFQDRFAKASHSLKKILEEGRTGMAVVLGGIISESKEILTKKNERMAFITLSDFTGSIECAIFPKIYELNKELFTKDQTIAVKAKVSERNGEKSLLIESVKLLSDEDDIKK